jgi:hypothetical protein
MSKRIIAGLAIIAAVALAPPAGAAPTRAPARPFTGSAVTSDTMGPPDGCTLPGAMWSYRGEGTGTFAHLGRVSFEIDHCSKMTGPTSGVFGGGTITLTAANGDELYMSEEGTFELVMGPTGPVTSLVDLSWKITGGNGRFAGAEGAGTSMPVGDLATSTTSATYNGWISYDASAK